MKQTISIKILLLLVCALMASFVFAQNNVNKYKYVIIPERFNFSKEDNQYSLNTTTKLWLEQKGFVAFVGSKDLPQSVAANRCNALTAEVVQNNGLLTTKLTFLLKDCHGNVLFKSKEGKSREKVFAIAYNEALSDALSSLSNLNYKYDSTALVQLQSEASDPLPQRAEDKSITTQTEANRSISQKQAEPERSLSQPSAVAPSVSDISGILYAQSIDNGFQLVDTSPRKVMELLKTSAADNFIARSEHFQGVVFKKEGEWLLEYYKDNKLVSQKLSIRF